MKVISTLVLSFFLSFAVFAQDATFTTTKSGLKYKIIQKAKDAKPIQLADVVSFSVKVMNYKDSLLETQEVKDYKVQPSRYAGDVAEVFGFMAKGDSAVGMIPADSLVKLMGQLPPFLPAGSYIKYYFRIKDVRSALEVAKGKQAQREKQKVEESKTIAEYAKKNNLKPLITASGLQYVVTSEGAGRKPNAGEKVKVNYTGKLLSGRVFDTSIEAIAKANNLFTDQRPYQPIEFEVGKDQVIEGWDEGLALLKQGSKATFLIPSYLAYGERGAGADIPPHSILVFDVELVGVGQ